MCPFNTRLLHGSSHNVCVGGSRDVVLQVVSEISLLIDRLRQVATTAPYPGSAAKARDPDSLLPRGGKEKQVYEYLVSAGYAKVGLRQLIPSPVQCNANLQTTHWQVPICVSGACSLGTVVHAPPHHAPPQLPHGQGHLLTAPVQVAHQATPQLL
jgi:hypothetical protein